MKFVVAVDYDEENDVFLLIDENGEPICTQPLVTGMLGRVDVLSRRIRTNARSARGTRNGHSS